MFLRKDAFTELMLNIENYQFPHLKNEPWDSDWLSVKIQVKHPKGNWKVIDPCLLTFELKNLIEWFEKIGEETKIEKHLYFTEPCLEFELIEVEPKILRVFFSHELAPPWLEKGEETFFIDFVLTQKDLSRICENLKDDFKKFPIRVGI